MPSGKLNCDDGITVGTSTLVSVPASLTLEVMLAFFDLDPELRIAQLRPVRCLVLCLVFVTLRLGLGLRAPTRILGAALVA